MPITVFPTSAASSDRTTFGELKQNLARAINPDDETTLQIAGDSIVTALKVYARFNWPWDVVSVDISVVSGTELYSLPQKFKLPISCYELDGGGRPKRRIGYIPYASFLESYQQNQDGAPELYTVPNAFEAGQALFYPRPTSSFTAKLSYYRMGAFRFRDDSEPLGVPDYADEPIRAWAWYEMLKKLGGAGNINRIPSARSDALAARAELVALVNSRCDMLGPA